MYLQETLGGQENPYKKLARRTGNPKNATTFLRGRKIIKERYNAEEKEKRKRKGRQKAKRNDRE